MPFTNILQTSLTLSEYQYLLWQDISQFQTWLLTLKQGFGLLISQQKHALLLIITTNNTHKQFESEARYQKHVKPRQNCKQCKYCTCHECSNISKGTIRSWPHITLMEACASKLEGGVSFIYALPTNARIKVGLQVCLCF